MEPPKTCFPLLCPHCSEPAVPQSFLGAHQPHAQQKPRVTPILLSHSLSWCLIPASLLTPRIFSDGQSPHFEGDAPRNTGLRKQGVREADPSRHTIPPPAPELSRECAEQYPAGKCRGALQETPPFPCRASPLRGKKPCRASLYTLVFLWLPRLICSRTERRKISACYYRSPTR